MKQIIERSLSTLVPYESNPRKNDHAVPKVADAIKRFGFRVPILITSNGSIVDGHLRYKAALSLGLESVPCLLADDMSEAEIHAFRLSVNKMAELAKWDYKLLDQELKLLEQLDSSLLSFTGFSEVELNSSLNLLSDSNLDVLPEKIQPRCKVGDLWQLGDHYLFVGDATLPEAFTALAPFGKADLIWTDPPYNVDYSGKAGKIKNDSMSPAEFDSFLGGFYAQAFSFLKEGGPIYVAHADGIPGISFRSQFVAAGFYFSTCLIWRKNQATIGRSDYQFQHEPILYGWKPGKAHSWYGGRKQRTVISLADHPLFYKAEDGDYCIEVGAEILKVSGDNVSVKACSPTILSFDKPLASDLHPTMKPVSLVEYFLLNSSCPGDVVLDPFGGSGTTLIACEQQGRVCRTVEFDPVYADVIIARWEDLVGGSAVKI